MAKLKLKFDFKKIIGMLKTRYELLGLAVAGGLATVCILYGMVTFLGASSQEGEIQKDVKALIDRRDRSPRPTSEDTKKENAGKTVAWTKITYKDAQLEVVSPFASGAAGNSFRVEPKILSLDNEAGGASFQIDYLHKGFHTYFFNTADKLYVFKNIAKGGNPEPVVLVAGKRLVVVTGTFPYEKQVEEYRKALRFDSDDEVFAKFLAPTFEGLNVKRRAITIDKDGKQVQGEWEPLYLYDPAKDKVTVDEKIEKLMKTAVYDDRQVDIYGDMIYGATVTPLPLLTNETDYPKINLEGVANRPPPAVPPPPDPTKPQLAVSTNANRLPYGQPRATTMPKPVTDDKDRQWELAVPKDLQAQLKDQISGVINWFSPFGTFVEDPNKVVAVVVDPKAPPAGKTPDPSTGGPVDPVPLDLKDNHKAPLKKPASPKALVRFVDVDMQPGVTYQYAIQVRMANPNYGQPVGVVPHSGVSEPKELLSEWTETPTQKIPNDDCLFYITNRESKFVTRASTKLPIDTTPSNSAISGKLVPFEIHRFVDAFDASGKRHYIGDFAIAERLLVARGEPIGRECEVEMVEWNKEQAQWHVSGLKAKLQPIPQFARPPQPTGLLCNFRPDPAVVLLDFVGGKMKTAMPKGLGAVEEDAATEALLLMPDMTMKLRNSQNDTNDLEWDTKGPKGHPIGQERRAVFEAWKKLLDTLGTPPPAAIKKG